MAEDVFGIVGTTQAGNFRVEKVVAEGGFAVVYRALHGGFRAPVAIKCLKIPEQMDPTMRDIFLEKFREEAELMFRLSAAIAEICRPLHVDVLHLPDGRFVPFLALEWLDGESLDGIVTRRREQGLPPLGLHKVLKMMRPVAGALAKAHRFPGPEGAVCIIHRDLKPENLFLANIHGVETMKILDFGIAKAKRAATQAVGRVTGKAVAEDEMASFTPAYGSPEQWMPKTWGETGPWTDVWGLALSMTEALCGHPPLDGEQWAMRRACLDEKRRPTPRSHGAADVPIEVEEVFEQALALDPRRRFKSVEAFWTALEKSIGLAPSLVRSDDRREPSGSGEPGPVEAKPGVALAQVALKKASPEALRPVPKPSVAMGAPLTARAVSGEWELDLAAATASSAAQHASLPADLEMSLPIQSERAPEPSAPGGSLELPLPTRSEPPPPAPVTTGSPPAAAQPPAPKPAPPRPPAPPEAQKPAPRAQAAPPPAEDNLDFDLNLAGPKRPSGSSSSGTFDPVPMSVRRSDHVAPPAPPPDPRVLTPWRRPPERQAVSERLRAPLGVLVLALVVACSEIGYHRITGEDLGFGGIRAFYLAAPLALFGVGFTIWRLMEDRDDG